MKTLCPSSHGSVYLLRLVAEIAYIIEIVAILVLHHVMHAKFELSTKV